MTMKMVVMLLKTGYGNEGVGGDYDYDDGFEDDEVLVIAMLSLKQIETWVCDVNWV